MHDQRRIKVESIQIVRQPDVVQDLVSGGTDHDQGSFASETLREGESTNS
ncbi:hypothetical protein ACFWUP_00720 [Nocardia sp. NPDC058658]